MTSVVSHLQPTNIEEKLQQGENGQVEVNIMARVTLSWIQKLTPNQTGQEETVDGHCSYLNKIIPNLMKISINSLISRHDFDYS